MKKNNLNTTHCITKHNILNELKCSVLSTEQYYLYLVYLSRIYSQPIKECIQKVVTIFIEDYARLLNVKKKSTYQLEQAACALTKTKVTLTTQTSPGVFTKEDVVLFDSITIKMVECENDSGEKLIKKALIMTCSSSIEKYLFQLKNNFTTYKMASVLQLKTYASVRLYEILVQYRKTKKRSITLSALKEYIGADNKYPRYKDFRKYVLDPAIKRINEKTDIAVSCYPIFSEHGKVFSITFNISSNKQKTNKPPSTNAERTNKNVINMRKKDVVAPDDRAKICLGFEGNAFLEYSKDELILLRNLANPLITKEQVEVHELYHETYEARQYAISVLLENIILDVNANHNVIDRKRYIFGVLKKKSQENKQ